MKNFITSLTCTATVTVSLIALQVFTPDQSVQAQSAETLLPLEEAGLVESSEGTAEVPGIGGPNRSTTMTDVTEPNHLIPNPQTPDVTSDTPDFIYHLQQTDACSTLDFSLVLVCLKF